MIRNYLVLFIRNLRRQKLFSVINLLGLTVSMASTLLIYLYVQHEFSYDRFHNHAERIYRINQTFIWGENNDNQFSSTGPGVAYAVRQEIPEVELMTSIHTPGNFILSYSNAKNEVISFEEDRVLAADTNFFSMFNFPFIKGNKADAFRQANTLVMTKSTAEKYFGTEEAVGKLVRLGGLNGDDQKTYEVTGVIADTPDNSYIEFDVLLSMKGFPVERLSWSWVWTQLETYVRLQPQADMANVRKKLAAIPKKHAEQSLMRAMNTSFDDYVKSGKKWELFLQPLTEIHLPSSAVLNRLNDSGDYRIIYSLIASAVFISLLSCINFMNLSTAQFTRRIKEASVRKILGMSKAGIGLSYVMEALAFCLVGLVVGVGLTQITLPIFNTLIGKQLSINFFQDRFLLIALPSLAIFMALISASYPAIFLTGFNPAEAIKGKSKAGREGKTFRNGLVVFQFSISIILLVCTAIVFQQLNYVTEKDLGFDKENLLVLNHVEAVRDGESLANAVMTLPGVKDASWSTSTPPRIWGGDNFTAEGASGTTFSMNYTTGDEHFLSTYNIPMKVGRNFSKDNPADVNRVIVNEMTLRKIGWPADESVIGKKLSQPGNDSIRWEIVGVVKDFHFWALNSPIEAMAIFHVNSKNLHPGDKQYVTLRVASQDSKDWDKTIAALEHVWKKHAGDSPFQYTFVDDTFADAFATMEKIGSALSVMAALAITIACLGLLGMIVFTLEQRTKEIGIRKVNGASMWDILTLISKGYTKLIILACLIGSPLAYWMMTKWLEVFAYRVSPSWWIFFAAGFGLLAIATLITTYHTVKAARTNPVDVLKDE